MSVLLILDIELQWIPGTIVRLVHDLQRDNKIFENARVLQDRNPYGGGIISDNSVGVMAFQGRSNSVGLESPFFSTLHFSSCERV